MKTSLRKLRGFASLHRHGADHHSKDRRDLRRNVPQFDELAQASQDMQDMKDCYDSLLSAAAATANSAYEFSESLREMGACLLEKTALNDDEESGKVLLMLGKVQFELQKLVDNYRSHLFQTITIPSESLLNELRTVEEMKRQCDGKRDVYDYMRQRVKGRGRSGKGESFSAHQLQVAHDEYDDEATLFVFRLKSLKQGQSRSLLTQAARHHAAQLCFFKKALKSLEAIEPHVKLVAELQHIDYQFTGLEDDDDDDDDIYDENDDGELSFDNGQNVWEQDGSSSRNSMELDDVEVTFPQNATLEASKENVNRGYRKSFSFRGGIRPGSQSAPLFAEHLSNHASKIRETQLSSARKFSAYVLPTPVETKCSNNTTSSHQVPGTLKTSVSGRTHNLWHSSPLEPKKYEQISGNVKSRGSTIINVQSVLRENNNNSSSARLPPPLADGLLFSHLDPLASSDFKKIKRHAFSGPITRKPWLTKPGSMEHPQLCSGPLLQNPITQLSLSSPNMSPKVSPKVSPSTSPTYASSPKISELHELPRPPANSASKSSTPLPLVGYSAPLASKGPLLPATNKLLVSKAATPLPTPSQVMTRSFSIPSSGLRTMTFTLNSEMGMEFSSPPLTPISLSNIQSSPTGSDTVNQTVQIRGAD